MIEQITPIATGEGEKLLQPLYKKAEELTDLLDIKKLHATFSNTPYRSFFEGIQLRLIVANFLLEFHPAWRNNYKPKEIDSVINAVLDPSEQMKKSLTTEPLNVAPMKLQPLI